MSTTRLLMANRGRGDNTESEPVLARVADGRLTLDLDDGDRLELDIEELIGLTLEDDHEAEAA